MTFSKFSAFKFSSYLAYLLPLAAALYWSLWTTVLVVAVVVAVGFLYHWYDEKQFLAADACAVVLIVIWNFYLCYAGNFQEPYFVIALLLTVSAFYFFLRKQTPQSYNFNHGWWHLLGALITLACIFTSVL